MNKKFKRVAKTAAKIALGSALAFGSIRMAQKQIPFITHAKPVYSMKVAFLTHNTNKHANQMLADMDLASKKGKPVKLLFIELAGARSKTYMRDVKALDSDLVSTKNKFTALVKRGVSKETAFEECKKSLGKARKMNDEFLISLFTGAAIRGVKVLPIEEYSEREFVQMNEMSKKIMRSESEWERLCNSNATLGELVQNEMKKTKMANDLQKLRNKRIAEGMEKRLDLAVKIFPQLKLERLKGKEINAMGNLGLWHNKMYFDFNHANKRVRMDRELYLDKYALAERIMSQGKTAEEMTKKDYYMLVIGLRYFDPNVKTIAQTNSKLAEEFLNRALNTSEEKYVEIDRESAKISDPTKRGKFVMNSIIGSRFFK